MNGLGSTENGRSWIKLDGPKDFKWTICESGPEPSTSTLRFFPRDRPLLVEWPSTLTHESWPSTLAQKTVHYRPWPSTFARPFTLRTVHFHPFSPSTLDRTHFAKTVIFGKIYYYKKINLDSIVLQWFLKLMDIFSSITSPKLEFLDFFRKWHLLHS